MKKIILGLVMLLGMSSLMANEVKQEDIKSGGTAFIIGTEIINIYDNEDTRKTVPTGDDLTLLKNVLVKSSCKEGDIKNLIENSGYSLKYIYVHPTKITVIVVDSCKGV